MRAFFIGHEAAETTADDGYEGGLVHVGRALLGGVYRGVDGRHGKLADGAKNPLEIMRVPAGAEVLRQMQVRP